MVNVKMESREYPGAIFRWTMFVFRGGCTLVRGLFFWAITREKDQGIHPKMPSGLGNLEVHYLKLTASQSTWKWMVGIQAFPFGMAYFQNLWLLVSGSFNLSRSPSLNNFLSKSRQLFFWQGKLGVGFKYFLMFTLTWGNDPIWLAHIFQMGGDYPPTTKNFGGPGALKFSWGKRWEVVPSRERMHIDSTGPGICDPMVAACQVPFTSSKSQGDWKGIDITLPETNSSPPKMDGWKITFLLGWPIFRHYLSFRECTFGVFSVSKGKFVYQHFWEISPHYAT